MKHGYPSILPILWAGKDQDIYLEVFAVFA